MSEKDSPKGKDSASAFGGAMPRTLRMLAFWVVLLAGALLFMSVYYGDGAQRERSDLPQSEFEVSLREGRVLSAVIEEQAGGGIVRIVGKYVPQEHAAAAKTKLTPEMLRGFQSSVVYTERLDQLISQQCPDVQVKVSNGFWSQLWVSLLPLLVMLGILVFFSRRMFRSSGGSMMSFGKSRARMVMPGPNKVTLKDVAGIEEAKSEMQEIVDYLKDPQKFRRLGGKIPRGVLMVGPPGTGKTLLARAIAGEAEVPFFSVSGSDFDEMFVGVGTSRVRDMFEEGKKHAPCLIFIDELDAIGRSRYGLDAGAHAHEQTLNALLVEMDGFEANSGVIVLAATNRPDVLDKALLRPGRFDRQITIDLPDLRGRLGILQIHANKICIDPKVDLRVVARGTAGFSGADLANLINEAALLATRTGKDQVGLAELEEARDKVCWGKERRSRRISDNERRLIAFHEAGHALVNMLCDHTKPLHKITIIPRGIAYLGATMQLPEQDRYTIAYSELLDDLAVSMGGRVAESLVFHEVSSGAAGDIRAATSTARRMVCSYGMSSLGPLDYANSNGTSFLGHTLANGEANAPETVREVDLAIRKLVQEAEERVRSLLSDNLDKLTLLAETLLERETMNAEDVYALLGMEMPPSQANPDDLEDPREQKQDSEPTQNGGDGDGTSAASAPAGETASAPADAPPTQA